MYLMKLVSAIFTLYQNLYCYFFQVCGKGESDNDNGFKIFWISYRSRAILDSGKQTKWNIWY